MTAALAIRPVPLPIHAGLLMTTDPDDAARLRGSGWRTVGVGADRRTGVPVYVLEREPSTGDGTG